MAFGIVAAGGSGARLQAGIPKLEIEVLGKPILMYSLEAFQQAESIERLIVVVPPERVPEWSIGRLEGEGITKIMASVAGGASRQESVRLALEEIPEHRGTVVVHDGARPLVTPELIERVASFPEGVDGVITAVPVTDTVKEREGDRVKKTVDRERLVSVQTPQSFPLDTLRKAHRQALKDGYTGTDDSVLVERMGGEVRVVEGSRDNLKVTYRADLAYVEAVLKGRRET